MTLSIGVSIYPDFGFAQPGRFIHQGKGDSPVIFISANDGESDTCYRHGIPRAHQLCYAVFPINIPFPVLSAERGGSCTYTASQA
jgi:hypothetical protein